MNNSNYELFEDYLRGDLSPQEGADLISSLSAKEKADFELYKSIRQTMDKDNLKVPEELKENLAKMGEKHFKSQKAKTKKLPPMYLRIAAAFILLAGAAFLYFNLLNTSPNIDQLVEEFYYSKKSIVTTRGVHQETAFSKAMLKYETGNYKEANALFQNVDETDGWYQDALYYRANSNLKNGNYQLSIQLYTELESYRGELAQFAEWNKMLAYLKLENHQKVDSIINSILNKPDHVMIQKAKEFRKKY